MSNLVVQVYYSDISGKYYCFYLDRPVPFRDRIKNIILKNEKRFLYGLESWAELSIMSTGAPHYLRSSLVEHCELSGVYRIFPLTYVVFSSLRSTVENLPEVYPITEIFNPKLKMEYRGILTEYTSEEIILKYFILREGPMTYREYCRTEVLEHCKELV